MDLKAKTINIGSLQKHNIQKTSINVTKKHINEQLTKTKKKLI